MEQQIVTSVKEVEDILLNFTNERLVEIYEEFLTRNYKAIDIQVRNCINEEIAKRYYKKLL